MKKFHARIDCHLMAEDIDDALTRLGIHFVSIRIENGPIMLTDSDIRVGAVDEGTEKP
jgi:pentose-5-phosphate-3-epimerase